MNAEQHQLLERFVEAHEAIAAGLDKIGNAMHRLGTADAATPMGAIELLAKEVRDGLDGVASSLGEKS